MHNYQVVLRRLQENQEDYPLSVFGLRTVRQVPQVHTQAGINSPVPGISLIFFVALFFHSFCWIDVLFSSRLIADFEFLNLL